MAIDYQQQFTPDLTHGSILSKSIDSNPTPFINKPIEPRVEVESKMTVNHHPACFCVDKGICATHGLNYPTVDSILDLMEE